MARLGDFFRNLFASSKSSNERIAAYIVREHDRGRTLEDEVRVLEEEGLDVKVAPFTRQEILPKLERRFLHEM